MIALAVVAVLWVWLLWAAAGWRDLQDRRSARWLAATAAYALGSHLCHQRPERSFDRGARPLPVCGRCTGLYVGAALAFAAVAAIGPRPRGSPRRYRRAMLLAAAPTALIAVGEWSGAGDPGNVLRGLLAVPLGAAAAWIAGMGVLALGTPLTALSSDSSEPIAAEPQSPSPARTRHQGKLSA
jgi:uncharacterized membrane protein